MGRMIVQPCPLRCGLGPGETNAYLLMNQDTRELLVVDPAGEADRIRRKIDEMGGKPVGILLTHAHFDHLMALREIKVAYGIPVYCGEGDRGLLRFFMDRLAEAIAGFVPCDADIWVKDQEVYDIAGFSMKTIATPGHSRGSVCFYFEEEGLLISGDTLFRESVGRTDFPEQEMKGDHDELMRSIGRLMATLPDEVRVLPGHGPATTVGHERNYNPFIRKNTSRS